MGLPVSHTELLTRAENIAAEARSSWNRTGHVAPCVITWPKDTVKADDGMALDGAIVCLLSDTMDPDAQLVVLQKMVMRTNACGLVLVEERDEVLRVVFETQHGARAWLMPLRRHGDVVVCEVPAVEDNKTCVGLLWSPAQA